MKRFILLVAAVFIIGNGLKAQVENLDKYVLTLDDVIDMAITQSSAIKYSQNRNVNYFWRYRNFKTRFRPQLRLNGDLPNYQNTTSPITQPDGSIEFVGLCSFVIKPVYPSARNQSLCQYFCCRNT